MPYRQLCQQRVDGADLDARLATCVAQCRGTDVVFAIRLKQGQGGKAFHDLRLCLGAREPLRSY